MSTVEGTLYYLREDVNPEELTQTKRLYMYHYQFKPTPRPILVDNNGHEYKYAFVSDLGRLTYMEIPFSVIYLDQTMKIPHAREEVSFMDKVTKIPDPIENSIRT